MGLRGLVYRLYEHRLEAALVPEAVPRHVGVMCDGNRRWARSAGFPDVSSGHRKGADKIFELLDWCRDAGVEVVTLWLLSTDNLVARPESEIEPLGRLVAEAVVTMPGPALLTVDTSLFPLVRSPHTLVKPLLLASPV